MRVKCDRCDSVSAHSQELEARLAIEGQNVLHAQAQIEEFLPTIKALAETLKSLVEPCRARETDDSHIDMIEAALTAHEAVIKRARGEV